MNLSGNPWIGNLSQEMYSSKMIREPEREALMGTASKRKKQRKK